MRRLYLALHGDELSDEERSRLNFYHNLNEIHPFDMETDYSRYYKFYISRNPYERVVSAFLDQFAYAKNKRVQEMLEAVPPKNGVPQNFIEFLEYLQDVPDSDRDSHFQTQAYFGHPVRLLTRRKILRPRPEDLVINRVGIFLS